MKDLMYAEETYKIRGALFEVYTQLGCGFLEAVYQEAVQIEFEVCRIPFYAQKGIIIHYKSIPLKQKYIPDFICWDKIIVELKAVKKLSNEHKAQILNYLKATGIKIGLLVNFNHFPNLQIERVIL